jgi:energy-coupling factor transporter transmembrane protein EcfT
MKEKKDFVVFKEVESDKETEKAGKNETKNKEAEELKAIHSTVTNGAFIVIVIFLMSALIATAVGTILSFLLPVPAFYLLIVWVILFVILVIRYFYKSWGFIPNDPPHVGLATFWGKRIPIVKEEGWRLFAPFFPLLYYANTMSVQKRNVDLVFADVRTKEEEESELEKAESDQAKKANDGKSKPRAGGELKIHISYTYYPNYKGKEGGENLIRFKNSGGDKGVQNIIKDQIAERLRQKAGTSSWQEFTFSQGEIKEDLIEYLTGKKFDDVEREINTTGVPDVHDLGILMCRFNVGRIKEQGKLAEVAEISVTQKQKIRGAKRDLAFIKKETKELTDLGVPAPEAVDSIQTQMGNTKKSINSFHGLDTGIISAIAGKILSGSENTKSKKNKQ